MIFTFLLWLCTLRSTVVFSSLFLSLWITFLLLATSYIVTPNVNGGVQNENLQKAGAMFGLIAAFLAWYVAFAGIADDSNRYVNCSFEVSPTNVSFSFFVVPVFHFPWSDKGREARRVKSNEEKV